jgi:hypothetical protein
MATRERRRQILARVIRRALERWVRDMKLDVHPLELEILAVTMVDVVEYAETMAEIEQ